MFPLKFTDIALAKVVEARDSDSDLDSSFAVRVACRYGGCAGYRHELDFDNEIHEGDLTQQFDLLGESITAVIDEESAKILQGVTINYITSTWNEGFAFEGGDNLSKVCACGTSASYCVAENSND